MTLIPSEEIRPGKPVDLNDETTITRTSKFLLDGLREHGPAIGLSAVQIGFEHNMFVIDFGLIGFDFEPFKIDIVTFINCKYKSVGKKGLVQEGCLSLPGYLWQVPRYRITTIEGYYWDGMSAKPFVLPFITHPLACIAFQHEIDHQDGILISQIGRHKQPVPTFEEAEDLEFSLNPELDTDRFDYVEVDASGAPVQQTKEDVENRMVIKNQYQQTKSGIIIPGA